MFRRLKCSFCGRSAAQVEKLVAGRHAYICDRCAQETIRIMEQAGEPPTAETPGLVRRIVSRLWQPRVHPPAQYAGPFESGEHYKNDRAAIVRISGFL